MENNKYIFDQMTCHIPNRFVEESLKRSIKNEEYQEYAPPMGIPLLHELILEDFKLKDTDAVVCVTDGSLPAIFQTVSQLAFKTFIDSEPAWKWPRLYNNNSLELVPGKIKPSDIMEDSLVNICNPQNPMGHLYTKEELEKIGRKAAEMGAYILYDCTYKDFTMDEYYPLYKLNSERTITTWSMSKSPGMAGMRVGGVICSPDMMEKIFKFRPNQLGSSFPGQKAAIVALYLKDQWLPALRKIVALNRDCMYNNLPDCTFPMEDASSSVWVELPEKINSTKLTSELKKEEMFVRDGIYYQEYGYEGNFIKVGTAVPLQWIADLCKMIKKYMDIY